MERMTKTLNDGTRVICAEKLASRPEGYAGEAAQRLAALEDLWEHLLENRRQMAQQMETLRAQGKSKSCRFRELMGQKLTESNTLALFDVYGLR